MRASLPDMVFGIGEGTVVRNGVWHLVVFCRQFRKKTPQTPRHMARTQTSRRIRFFIVRHHFLGVTAILSGISPTDFSRFPAVNRFMDK
jgi:hypothetical protein